jgi:hypothetical protein
MNSDRYPHGAGVFFFGPLLGAMLWIGAALILCGCATKGDLARERADRQVERLEQRIKAMEQGLQGPWNKDRLPRFHADGCTSDGCNSTCCKGGLCYQTALGCALFTVPNGSPLGAQ